MQIPFYFPTWQQIFPIFLFSVGTGLNKYSGDTFLGGRGEWGQNNTCRFWVISASTEWIIILISSGDYKLNPREKKMEMKILERGNFKLWEWMQSLQKRKEKGVESRRQEEIGPQVAWSYNLLPKLEQLREREEPLLIMTLGTQM